MATNPTLLELETDLNGRLSAAQTSGFWTQAEKDLAINNAGRQVCESYNWQFLELALKTQTRNKQEYYDYPNGTNVFTQGSIYQIEIADEVYGARDGRGRMKWGEFQRRKHVGDSNRKIFSNHNGYYFLYPIPVDGKEMTLFGLKEWNTLVATTDSAITPPSLNSSIIGLALSVCLKKAKKYNEATIELNEVIDPRIGSLVRIWNKMNEENASGFIGSGISSHW